MKLTNAFLGLGLVAALGFVVACDGGQIAACGSGNCGDAGVFTDGQILFADSGADYSGSDGPPNCGPNTTVCKNACCTADQLCVQDKCETLGPPCDELWPCPTGFYCNKGLGRCAPGAGKCEYRPKPGDFNPHVEWAWTTSKTLPAYNQVMMAPMVANINDDNNDGKIDRNDIPDIIFHTFTGHFYTKDGVMRVISGDGKKEIFTVSNVAHRTHPGTQIAIGDIDGDKRPEIVACASGGGLIVFEDTGALKWKNAKIPCSAPAIADIDADGKVEVISCYSAVESQTGKLLWTGRAGCPYTTVVDIDEDGKLEIVGGNAVVSHDGKVQWEDKTRPDGFVAVADLDGDGKPEIVTATSSDHALRAVHHDGKPYWGPVDINQGHGTGSNQSGGGPPTIADFDGDGKPEIAAAGGWGYVIFEHDGKPKWFAKTRDLSSRVTGSSVFDFEGDGKAEVVYSDELELKIYDGITGKVLYRLCNTSGTLMEYPLIVDVDNDGHAEIVVANNNYAFKTCADNTASSTGIKVLGDKKNNWVRTRRIWNQHTYHVTNVDEDGIIPKTQVRNWDNPALNNFRQNVQPGGLFDAPDLTAQSPKNKCANQITVDVLVKNEGAAKVAPGVKVTLYAKDPTGATTALDTQLTKTTINPGQSETISFSVKTPASYVKQTIELYAVVDDDGKGVGLINECNEKNNQTTNAKVTCTTVN